VERSAQGSTRRRGERVVEVPVAVGLEVLVRREVGRKFRDPARGRHPGAGARAERRSRVVDATVDDADIRTGPAVTRPIAGRLESNVAWNDSFSAIRSTPAVFAILRRSSGDWTDAENAGRLA
jgi:hypothetical protein